MKRADFEDTELDGKENISKVMNWVSLAHAEIMDSLSGSGAFFFVEHDLKG